MTYEGHQLHLNGLDEVTIGGFAQLVTLTK
jgi:hypothetical protein